MSRQVAFALITPHTIRKSRTGAVWARLLGRTSCDLIAVRMFAPTRELAEAYAANIRPVDDPDKEADRELIRSYIRTRFAPQNGRPERVMMLVFAGENAREEISDIVGPLRISNAQGETIRDAFGDLVRYPDGRVQYFEPAVLATDTEGAEVKNLRLWMEFARQSPPLLTNVCSYTNPDKVERTVVMIKPDSWRTGSARPGAILGMFSRTGLRIIGMKLCHMSVAQALQFYGPVQISLRQRLAPGIGSQARKILERELQISLPDSVEANLAESVGIPFAENQFEKIVSFMSGMRPSECKGIDLNSEGSAPVLAMVYEGENAVTKIRNVLGPTDPTKAPSGTVRWEFGSDVMINTAHASDSPENAQREINILNMERDDFALQVDRAIKECEALR